MKKDTAPRPDSATAATLAPAAKVVARKLKKPKPKLKPKPLAAPVTAKVIAPVTALVTAQVPPPSRAPAAKAKGQAKSKNAPSVSAKKAKPPVRTPARTPVSNPVKTRVKRPAKKTIESAPLEQEPASPVLEIPAEVPPAPLVLKEVDLWEKESPIQQRLSQLRTRNAQLTEQLQRLKPPVPVRGKKS